MLDGDNFLPLLWTLKMWNFFMFVAKHILSVKVRFIARSKADNMFVSNDASDHFGTMFMLRALVQVLHISTLLL